MVNLPPWSLALIALGLVACPASEDPQQASATALASSTSTTGLGETSSSSGDDPSSSTSSDMTTGTTTSSGSSTGGPPTSAGSLCGDGFVEAGEQCDDGKDNSPDGPCALDCTKTCGDGILQGDEECDLGELNDNTGTCTKECLDARCGDDYVQPGELCDEGEKNSPDPGKCDPITCTPNAMTCGDGALDDDEECDKSAPGMEAVACTESCFYVSRMVFVTPGTYSANFKDLDEDDILGTVDQICQNLAGEANLPLPESFIALLSTPGNPIDERIGGFTGKYADTTATRVAIGSEALLSGSLELPITLDQFGLNAMAQNTLAWTGSLISGAESPDMCESWGSTSPLKVGTVGALGEKSSEWIDYGPSPCNYQAHLYCLQNADLL